MKTISTAIAAALCSTTAAHADLMFPLHPKRPVAEVTFHDGIGGAQARIEAAVGEAQARDWCANFSPGEPEDECSSQILANEADVKHAASADCNAGSMIGPDGASYRYVGQWRNTPGGDADGWPKFEDAASGAEVGTSNAEGGLTLAAQWRVLCPFGAPYALQPLVDVVGEGDRSSNTEIAGHNGSGMMIDYDKGTISYASPRDALVGSVPVGRVLFRGFIAYGGPVEGMAFVFRRGCEPAAYRVSGHWPGNSDKLVLRGTAPVREGCDVVGYTMDSPNSELVFDLPHH